MVALDTAQYQLDVNALAAHGGEDLYGSFNLIMRRKPKENNFKAVLQVCGGVCGGEAHAGLPRLAAGAVWLCGLCMSPGLLICVQGACRAAQAVALALLACSNLRHLMASHRTAQMLPFC